MSSTRTRNTKAWSSTNATTKRPKTTSINPPSLWNPKKSMRRTGKTCQRCSPSTTKVWRERMTLSLKASIRQPSTYPNSMSTPSANLSSSSCATLLAVRNSPGPLLGPHGLHRTMVPAAAVSTMDSILHSPLVSPSMPPSTVWCASPNTTRATVTSSSSITPTASRPTTPTCLNAMSRPASR